MSDEKKFQAVVQAFAAYGSDAGREGALSLAAQLVAHCLIPPHVYAQASNAQRRELQDAMEELVVECLHPLLEPAGLRVKSDAPSRGAPN